MKTFASLTLFLSLALSRPILAQDNLREVPPADPEYELRLLNVAEGFEINLFAADPMIEKPIQMTWDERGRLWVIGSAIYPHLLPGQKANDKVFVLEDTDGDGEADKSTVFADGLLTPTGLLVGDGGAYVANSTEILHLRDLDGDGYAEDRRVVLRGFGADDVHHLIHSFRWGPDGMMYFNQSIYIFSHIETPWGVRRLRQGGIWRYRTDNQKLEVFARGFYNPWGHSFDAFGQSFVTDGAAYNGINHVFPGAAFEASYQAERILKGLNSNQPKHSGLAIVSGRHMPDSLQGRMVTNDFRANRVNQFTVVDEEDGYVSTLATDLIWTDHVAFRPVDVDVGPDGAIYIVDWYNPIIQHGEVDFRDPRRDHVHGRIWRITARDRPLVEIPDLTSASVGELLEMLRLPEQWTRMQARRLLKERGASEVLPALKAWAARYSEGDAPDDQALLEALWIHQSLDVVDEALLANVLDARDPRIRAAGVRVLNEWQDRVDDTDAMLEKAVHDPHYRVRREALTTLGRRATAEAARTALSVLDLPMNDELDFALWTTLRELEPQWAPRLASDPSFFGEDLNRRIFAWKAVHTPEAIDQLVALYTRNEISDGENGEVLDLIVRYGGPENLDAVLRLALSGENIGEIDRAAHLAALLEAASTYSRRPAGSVEGIGDLLRDANIEIRRLAVRLIGSWKLTSFADTLAALVDPDVDAELRRAAIDALALMNDEPAKQHLIALLNDSQPADTRIQAAAALLRADPGAATPYAIDMLYTLPASANPQPIFSALYTREESRQALEEALRIRPIPASFATVGLRAYRGRQRDAGLIEALEASGGVPPVQRMPQALNAWDMDRLELDVKSGGDPARGELVYRRKELACTTCHAIAGAGGRVGPDLSSVGANAPIDYLIESLLSPEKAVKDGFALTRVTRKDGQVVIGTLIRETGSAVLVRDASDAIVTIPSNLIDRQEILPGSLMPAGLTASLHREEFVDLTTFLSQLGKEGPFRAPTASFVRIWDALQVPPDAISNLIPYIDASEPENWQTVYSYVDGSIRYSELPMMEVAEQEIVVLRFWVDVASPGPVSFSLNQTEGIRYREGDRFIETTGEIVEFDLPAGLNPVVLVIDTSKQAGDSLRIELSATDGPVRAQLNHAGIDR